ncbi:hypothetical protein [Mangrovimonas sp. YM274]|uniref:DUF6913 domain-containing protein n=1 Tax=Mangrovimonas sp. YM274 TaxID=3070660 RepID=UPI0027DDB06C|nr:hypothetical protein [Mangrovimonas sp. YM274]WMI67611.1 hypothetical protein RBH95_10695 [Mangrovimonas sp. YM274]
MILKAFKEKSYQNYINKLLNSRNIEVGNKKIDSVGVILNLNEFSDFENFQRFLEDLGVKRNRIAIIVFVADEKLAPETLWGVNVTPKDFGWKGAIKNSDLKAFVDKDFDALISYYKEDRMELNIITAQSKSRFKVGLSGIDDRLYDLILDVHPKEFSLFKRELHKYLTVLNKL